MQQIIEAARDLSDKLKNSGLYKEYKQAKTEVYARAELVTLHNEYKRLARELAAQNDGEPSILQRKERVSAAYFAAASHYELKRFLDAERALVELMCDVLDIVADGCQISIDG